MLKFGTKMLVAIGAFAAVSGSALMIGTGPAEAKVCSYQSVDSAGRQGDAKGWANARKMSTACDRARRECDRRLERAFRKGKAGRGAKCYKLTEVGA